MRFITKFIFVLGLIFGSTSFAQDFYIYPTKGQTQEQTDKDKFECYSWAKNQTGFDPMQLPTASSPPPAQEAKQGGLLRGAAGGAIIGEIAGGHGGEGAAIGALLGGARRSQQKQRQQVERQQWEQQQASQYSNARNQYNRAYVACLEARGYSVK